VWDIPPNGKGLCISTYTYIYMYMGVFINGGPPKSMVDFMENPIEMDDLGVPPFQETSILRIT
jgi:hypothetical protein